MKFDYRKDFGRRIGSKTSTAAKHGTEMAVLRADLSARGMFDAEKGIDRGGYFAGTQAVRLSREN